MKFQILSVSIFLAACSTTNLTVTSSDPASVSLVDFNDESGSGEIVGKTPIDIPIDRLEGYYLKITSDKKSQQNWVFTNLQGENIKIFAQLNQAETVEQDNEEDENGNKAKTNNKALADKELNKAFTLILKSYQSLSGRDYKSAIDLSKEAVKIYPNIAAPHIIMGLASIGQGDRASARSSFKKARIKNPDDKDIEILIESVSN